MAAIASIAVDDGQATPVTHTFNPVAVLPNPSWAENDDASLPTVGQPTFEVKMRKGNANSAVDSAECILRVPVLETPQGGTPEGYVAPPEVAYHITCSAKFLLPKRSTAEQRKDVRIMMVGFLQKQAIASLVDSLEQPY